MSPMNEPGYEKLADVFSRAFDQAARGKGKERHAQGEPFHKQVMQEGARRFGHGALLFQAFKKSEESQRLPHDRAIAELLGSMVYLAGAVIALERAAAVATEPLKPQGEWIEWGGGECPVDPLCRVEIKLRNDGFRKRTAHEFIWTKNDESSDIVAYRVCPDGL